MTDHVADRPWEDLRKHIGLADLEQVRATLDGIPAGELGLAISRLEADDRTKLFALLSPDECARLLGLFEDSHAAELIERLQPVDAAAIVAELPSNDSADIVSELDDPRAEAILQAMEPDQAAAVRSLVKFPGDVAGGLMVTEVLSYPETSTIEDVVDDLRRNADTYADYHVQYIYVVDGDGHLSGVLQLRDLLLRRPGTKLHSVMLSEPVSVDVMATLEDLELVFDRYPFLGLPVVRGGRLHGLLRRANVEEALAQRAARTFRLVQGIVGGEELRTMPVLRRAGRRLSWLSVNILLNVAAASVIVAFEATLTKIIALAAFLPIISDMSGCSGNQAVAVSMRELSLGLVQPREVLRVWGKELAVGVINGLVLGALLGFVAWLWKGNASLGIVVGGALAINTVVAVSIGGTIPLLLKRLGFDPALASGPILTTVTDMCGFFFALGFATVALHRLVG